MKVSFQFAIVAAVSSLLVVLLVFLPKGALGVIRWGWIAVIPMAIILLFGCLRIILGRQVSRRAYLGLLPLALYWGISISLTGLLADHYEESRALSLGKLIEAYPLEALFTFSLGASVTFLGLSLMGLLGVGLAGGLCNLVRPQLTDGGDGGEVN